MSYFYKINQNQKKTPQGLGLGFLVLFWFFLLRGCKIIEHIHIDV